jgi:hypothetical protein
MAGDRLDLTSETSKADSASGERRPFLGVRFACCGMYCRIYRNKSKSAYEGRCPKCAKPVRVGIGSEGSSSRFFEVT